MDKIIKLAKKLEGLIEDDSNLQEVYDALTNIMVRQKEYFKILKPISIIKLAICIYSFKKTGEFKLAANIISKLFFAAFIQTDSVPHKESCDECGGDGYISCGTCDMSGQVDCENCNGSGEEDCDECGGSGEVGDEGDACDECQGGGKLTCSECDGDLRTTCSSCGGDGSEDCHECDGLGEIETDKIVYDELQICSWDESLKNRVEITENVIDPTMSLNSLFNNKKLIVINVKSEEAGNTDYDFDSDKVYCYGYSTSDTDLIMNSLMKVSLDFDNNYFN